jgi:serine/threonine protein phosphatase Stp1
MNRIRHSALTHIGKTAKINEDSILSLPDLRLWVVSDGMGGHQAGDFASQTVVEAVASVPEGLPPVEMLQELRQALARAHDIVREEGKRLGATVGAAVVLMVLSDDHFAALWAGDCRLYRLRDNEIELLTTDHSIVAQFVLSGQMTWDEAEKLPNSNAITRAVGVGEALELDKIRGEVQSGDRYLLCSDGLNKYADFDTLRAMLAEQTIERVGEELLQIALEGGGRDNISIIVIDIP